MDVEVAVLFTVFLASAFATTTLMLSDLQKFLLNLHEVNVLRAALHNDKHAPLEQADSGSEDEDSKNESADGVHPPPLRLEEDHNRGADYSKRAEEVTHHMQDGTLHVHVALGLVLSSIFFCMLTVRMGSSSGSVGMAVTSATTQHLRDLDEVENEADNSNDEHSSSKHLRL